MKRIATRLILVTALVAVTEASAEVYYSAANATNSSAQTIGPKAIHWKDAEGKTVDPQPTPALDDGNSYVFTNALKFSSGSFKGKAYLGSQVDLPTGAVETTANLGANNGTFKFLDATLVNGMWSFNAGGTGTFDGSYTIADGCTFTIRGQNNGSAAFVESATKTSNNQRLAAFTNTATLAGSANTKLVYCFTKSTGKSVDGETLVSGLTMSADASNFKGSYNVYSPGTETGSSYGTRYQWGYLKLASATAFGDSTGCETAVELGCDTTLELTSAVTQYATRKVKLNPGANKVAGVRALAGQSWTLTAPLSIVSGSFVKRNPGTVVLNGPYTVSESGTKNMIVEEGTLDLGKGGTFPSALSVTVKSGATLLQHVFIPGIQVTCEEGGTYTKDYQYDVPYEASTDTCTALDFTTETLDFPISLMLTEKMMLPFHAEKRLEVAKLPTGTTATVDDFTDASEKTYGLPRTSFVLEERDGYKALVLVARPVVKSTRNFVDADGGVNAPKATESPWSDGQPVGPDRDYLLTHELQSTGTNEFAGGSLTLGTTKVQLRYPDAYSRLKATLYPGMIWPNHGSLANAILKGELTLMTAFGSYSTSDTVFFETRWSNGGTRVMRLNLLAALKGVGTSGFRINFNGASARQMEVELSGDNSEYGGCMLADGYDTAVEGKEMVLVVNEAKNLGGPIQVSTGHALRLKNFSLLKPTASMTLAAENRCVSVAGDGGFLTPEGVELTIREKFLLKGRVYKKGLGTLALGGGFWKDSSVAENKAYIREGAIKVLTDASVEGLDCTFSDGAIIALDATAGLTKGLSGTIATVNEGDKIKIRLDTPSTEGTTFTVPVCTVPAEFADLTETFTVLKSVGLSLKSQLVKTPVQINGVDSVTYAVTYSPQGCLLIFR